MFHRTIRELLAAPVRRHKRITGRQKFIKKIIYCISSDTLSVRVNTMYIKRFPQLNGVNCQGENIADNGGLRQAYRAYSNFVAMNGAEQRLPGLEKYSPNQLFFIAYANIWCGQETKERLMYDVMTGVHSPGRFRVMGPLSNSWDFAQQFQCPVGPMSRMNKCILW